MEKHSHALREEHLGDEGIKTVKEDRKIDLEENREVRSHSLGGHIPELARRLEPRASRTEPPPFHIVLSCLTACRHQTPAAVSPPEGPVKACTYVGVHMPTDH